jgi:large subunit ribosomal protein L25
MNKFNLTVQARTKHGTQVAKQLRRAGWVPATLYGAGMDPISVQAEVKNLQKVLHQARATALVDVTIEGGDTYQVLLRQPVYHPVNDTLTHVDLMRVSSTALVRLEVPIELTGNAKGVLAGGILDHVLHSLEIECQAIAIPEHIAVDVSALEIGDHVTVGELKLEGVRILTDTEQTIATLSAPRAEEEASAETEAEEVEPEVVKRKKVTEEDEEK